MQQQCAKRVRGWLVTLVLAGTLLASSAGLAGAVEEGSKKADQGINTAGQKVEGSTQGFQNAADATGKKASSATKSGADKVGGFFDNTSKKVEGWMKGFEKKSK